MMALFSNDRTIIWLLHVGFCQNTGKAMDSMKRKIEGTKIVMILFLLLQGLGILLQGLGMPQGMAKPLFYFIDKVGFLFK